MSEMRMAIDSTRASRSPITGGHFAFTFDPCHRPFNFERSLLRLLFLFLIDEFAHYFHQ